jgi:hypothetical protein
MRQGQQNRRGRGRSSNNNNNNSNNHNSGRKPQNPLSRNFESSGPDVKIRGTAAQIAEKYITLARDASSSGDYIMAENYLQHAEHYNRIIMAAQAQTVVQNPHGGEHGPGLNGQYRPQQENGGGFAMRDQPQPMIEQPQPQSQQSVVPPGMEPQPEVAAEPAVSGEAGDTAPARGVDPDGRRRRRRYPAGGAPRGAAGNAAEPAANANGHNGSGNGLDSAGDGRPSDEILAN